MCYTVSTFPPIGRDAGKEKKMARKSVAVPDTHGVQLIPLEAIPQDVKDFVEEVWKRQQATPGRERITFDNDTERDTEFRQYVSYVAQRPAKLGGILAVRRSPSKDLPPHTMDVRFSADLEKNAAANANRESGQVSR
jgi:hypothetical protein